MYKKIFGIYKIVEILKRLDICLWKLHNKFFIYSPKLT
jgi:hypothetical protein